MTDKDLKKLSRADLLEMLIEQSTEVQSLRERLEAAESALQKRELAIDKAGSIAEASLQLSGIFEAAQAACEQYTENVRLLSQRQNDVCAQMERDARERTSIMLSEAMRNCEQMEADARIRCAEMVTKAKAESQAYWDEVSGKLEAYYQQHAGLRELLSMSLKQKDIDPA